MCSNTREREDQTPVIGYKIVYKDPKTGRYRSSVMGFLYRKDGVIPVVKVQRRLNYNWNSDILTSPLTFCKAHEGRTAVFTSPDVANHATRFHRLPNEVIVRVLLSKDLMEGEYGDFNVILGRRMYILEEVTI